MIKNLSYLLLVVGLAMGPAYWIYAKFYTGTQAMLLPLGPTSDGSPRVVEFKLSPEMAPVGLILHAQGSFSPNMEEHKPPKDRYAATLYKNGEPAKPLTFSLGVSNVGNTHPSFKEHLLLMQAVQAGGYRLEVAPAATPEIKLDRMQLEVRQNLHEPDSRVATVGMIVLILGILGLVAI